MGCWGLRCAPLEGLTPVQAKPPRLLQWLILQALLKKSLTIEAAGPGLSGFSVQLEGLIVLKAGKTGSFLK